MRRPQKLTEVSVLSSSDNRKTICQINETKKPKNNDLTVSKITE